MNGDNKNKLKFLTKKELLDLKKIVQIIEDIMLSKPKPYVKDYFEMEYFKDIDKLSVIRLLKKLDKDFEIIYFTMRPDSNDGVHISFINKEDESDFLNFKKALDNFNTEKQPIEKITLVDPSISKTYKVIINSNYVNYITADKSNKLWEMLALITTKELLEYKKYKNSYDYINSKTKSPFARDYEVSQILITKDGYIIPNIDIDQISELKFKTEYNKQKTK